MDTGTERRHYLNTPLVARFVRLHPHTWHKRIGLRAAVIGCPHKGDCGRGFMRVNKGSACGEECLVCTLLDPFEEAKKRKSKPIRGRRDWTVKTALIS